MSGFQGHVPKVSITKNAAKHVELAELERQARELLVGRMVTGVTEQDDCVLIEVSGGGVFTMRYEGTLH